MCALLAQSGAIFISLVAPSMYGFTSSARKQIVQIQETFLKFLCSYQIAYAVEERASPPDYFQGYNPYDLTTFASGISTIVQYNSCSNVIHYLLTGFPVEIGSFSDSFWYALFEIDIFPIHFVTTFISYCQFS